MLPHFITRTSQKNSLFPTFVHFRPTLEQRNSRSSWPRAKSLFAQALRGEQDGSGNPLINQWRYRRLRKLRLNSQPSRTAKRAHYLARHEMSKRYFLQFKKTPSPARARKKLKGRNGEGKLADKPGSVERTGRRPARRAIIPLDDVLPRRSSSLPGDSASSVDVPLFGLCPGWGLPCRHCHQCRGGLLPHRFTLA